MPDPSNPGAAWRPHQEPAFVPYQALRRLPVRSLLVLAPHPDDEVFGCGGLLALAAAQGVRAEVVVVSDGAAGGEAARREAESQAAARALGHRGALQFWRLPDRAVQPDAALVDRIRQAGAACEAQWLLAPSPFEVHPDHRAVCRAAIEACGGLPTTRLGFYEVGQPMLPNTLVDITAVMPLKLRAMRCFASQLAVQDYATQIAALNHYRAYTLGAAVRHAEALCFVEAEDLAGGLDGVLRSAQRQLQRRFAAMDNPVMDDSQLTPFAAPEGASPDTDGPVDRACQASDRSDRIGAACKAPVPVGRPGGQG